MGRFALFSVLCVFFGAPIKAYEVPEVRVLGLLPQGLQVSIPDEQGISLFAFHGKINEEMFNREAGTFSVDITKPRNGRWTYTTRGAKLKPGDKIYYWVNVDYDDGNGKRGYIKDDQVYTVTELVSIDTGSTSTTGRPDPVTPVTPITTKTTKSTTATPTCKPTPTRVNGKRSCQGKIIFQENFAALSEHKWQPEVKFAGDPNYEFVVYQNNRENLYVEKNKLYIKPTLTEDKYGKGFVSEPNGLNLGDACTGVPESLDCYQKPTAWIILPPVISAQVTTKNHFSFLYGVIEIRARLPRGDWIYPELFLRSASDAYGVGVDSGLITIGFTPGNAELSKQLYGGCILGQSTAARNYALKNIQSGKRWTNDFHVYKVEWKTDRITLLVDDHVYGNIFPPEGGFASAQNELELEEATAERWKTGSTLAPFDKEMYLSIGVGAGGQCFTDRNDGIKPWDNDDPKAQLNFYRNQDTWSSTWGDNNTLIVDYVKVWAL